MNTAERVVRQLDFYISNIEYAILTEPKFYDTPFNKGRLEAWRDARQMIIGDRGED